MTTTTIAVLLIITLVLAIVMDYIRINQYADMRINLKLEAKQIVINKFIVLMSEYIQDRQGEDDVINTSDFREFLNENWEEV